MKDPMPDAPAPLLPIPDALTQFFWDGVAQSELRIQRCQQCRKYIHYPRPVCRFCRSRDLRGEPVSGRATLYSWTIATQAFHPFWVERVSFTIATVELAEQERLMFLSQIVACPESELRAGMPLEVVFERVAPELTLPFFKPVAAAR
ncbi:MAG TPA: OB-fold domain-containing protein [Myxococcota bacterium]|nr:OB-fold domain-containing protein [Myxococcota bacterium]